LKGYEAAEIIGRPYATFFSAQDRERGLPATALHTAATVGRFETEGWRIRKDGSRFWALAVIIDAVRDEAGELILASAALRASEAHGRPRALPRRSTTALADGDVIQDPDRVATGLCQALRHKPLRESGRGHLHRRCTTDRDFGLLAK
jgi:hypothetical protein